ncbi:MAG: RagB/SusD family nutrient uptake outer membrane protein, partial [Rhodothermales bacterium]|nr:RagB/SusD family nutrient uptake outer membrane protein [Rhodothermales bacterium]
DLDLYLIDVGVIGREYYRFSSADPRFTSDLLGQAGVLDNNSFFTTRPWAARYAAIRNACTLLQALEVTTEPLSDASKAAARGFANTWIAHQLLLNLNLTYDNGIRIDVCPLGETPPVVSPADAAYAELARILDEAAADLQAAGEAEFFFPVLMTPGGGGRFDTPAEFLEFNRAVAARVAVYRENWQEALDLLDGSFLDRALASADPLEFGAYHLFSTSAGDLTNPFFIDPQNPTGDALIVQPDFINDAAEEDQRVFEEDEGVEDVADPVVQFRVNDEGEPNPATLDDLTGSYGVFRYESNTAPIPIIRGAELILIRAEAHIQEGEFEDAIEDLNRIRNAAGLDDYDGDETEAALLDELLRQRRYELYAEGHRWIDVRRYGRLDELPLDRPGDEVFTQFPIPRNENV